LICDLNKSQVSALLSKEYGPTTNCYFMAVVPNHVETVPFLISAFELL